MKKLFLTLGATLLFSIAFYGYAHAAAAPSTTAPKSDIVNRLKNAPAVAKKPKTEEVKKDDSDKTEKSDDTASDDSKKETKKDAKKDAKPTKQFVKVDPAATEKSAEDAKKTAGLPINEKFNSQHGSIDWDMTEEADGKLALLVKNTDCSRCDKIKLALDKKREELNDKNKPQITSLREFAHAALTSLYGTEKKVNVVDEKTAAEKTAEEKKLKEKEAKVENCELVKRIDPKDSKTKFFLPTNEEQFDCATARIDQLLDTSLVEADEAIKNQKLAKKLFKNIIRKNYIADMMAGNYSEDQADANFSPYVKYIGELLNDKEKSILANSKMNLAIETQASGFFKALSAKHQEYQASITQTQGLISSGNYAAAQSKITQLKENVNTFNKLLKGTSTSVAELSKMQKVNGLSIEDFKKENAEIDQMITASGELFSLSRFKTDVDQLDNNLLRSKVTNAQRSGNSGSSGNKFFSFALDNPAVASASGSGATSKDASDFARNLKKMSEDLDRGFDKDGHFLGAGLSIKDTNFGNFGTTAINPSNVITGGNTGTSSLLNTGSNGTGRIRRS